MSEPITMSAEPCPFCGKIAELQHRPRIFRDGIGNGDDFRYECLYCAAKTCWWHTLNQALGAWNSRAELDATREAHKRTQDELQNVREAFIACSETLYAEREQLRHSQEVSKALLDACKREEWSGEWGHCPDCGHTKTVGHKVECVLGAAIALAERPDALRPAEVSAEEASGFQGERQ